MDSQDKSRHRSGQKQEEVSVAEAAQRLQVTERSILNFIRGKQIRAVKVGKSWFLDKASVLAFQMERVASSGSVPVDNGAVSEKRGLVSETTTPFSEKEKVSRRPRLGLRGLNCYQLALDIFAREAWTTVASESFLPNNKLSRDVFLSRINILQLQVLEALGAGYHTFGHAKMNHYGSARAAAGGLLALMSAHASLSGALESERVLIEEKLLPALIALQRTAEKRSRT